MGTYVNPDNSSFKPLASYEFYVDKTELINFTNSVLGVHGVKYICVSRPRRFGKTVAVDMLVSYYSRGCDSRELFEKLKAGKSPAFDEHLNSHNVIYVDMQQARSRAIEQNRHSELVSLFQEEIVRELAELYPGAVDPVKDKLSDSLMKIYNVYKGRFIFLIDEWDVIYREDNTNDYLKKQYTDLLRNIFKGGHTDRCIDLVYMTGILPIPGEETNSGLNNFQQYTMLDPCNLTEFTGFTEDEVKTLCRKHQMDFNEMKEWYDGYYFPTGSIYCPDSVLKAIRRRSFADYWPSTASGNILRTCLEYEMPGLKDAIGFLVAEQPVEINPMVFQNDAGKIGNVDSLLAYLVHMGYLRFDKEESCVSVPNREVRTEFETCLSQIEGNEIWNIIAASKKLLKDTLLEDAEAVAKAVQSAHDYYASSNKYNDENTLSAVVLLAYHNALDRDYMIVPEFPSGKGFADHLFLPLKPDRIPILIELKWNKDSITAINQIKERRYMDRLRGYKEVLLVGISYEKNRDLPGYKDHICTIERYRIK